MMLLVDTSTTISSLQTTTMHRQDSLQISLLRKAENFQTSLLKEKEQSFSSSTSSSAVVGGILKRGNSKKRSRNATATVSFSDNRNRAYEIWSVSDVEDPSKIWYLPSDYQSMREENKEIVQLMCDGHPEREGVCYRGLEWKLPRNRSIRNDAIAESWDVVICSQLSLDSESTAQYYIRVAKDSHDRAAAKGQEDSKIAKTILFPSSTAASTKREIGGQGKHIARFRSLIRAG